MYSGGEASFIWFKPCFTKTKHIQSMLQDQIIKDLEHNALMFKKKKSNVTLLCCGELSLW